ncbi:alpha-xenorhabdolysin family binary toxin subunit A [Haliangium ochraceum]|uniref:Uncharacterized protein n=1 Tax=Haliangium ochraceum (strain DSM 14365 / JCM 11303 / SMP-2) TaxID=502025 RepID=D0LUR2_HALO1|nr:alpha-xenorhabdolysin family binary toxin subunit A [Haliangium ochraceum]ACY13952.1 hypothetical protein Hoch_1398 [Haliangium ochraceum DSM 14365]
MPEHSTIELSEYTPAQHAAAGSRVRYQRIVSVALLSATVLTASACVGEMGVGNPGNQYCTDCPVVGDDLVDENGGEPVSAPVGDERACAAVDPYAPVADTSFDYALAPRSLTTEDGDFIISRDEWQAVHSYAESCSQLPIDELQLRERLSLDSAESAQPFLPIADAYADVQSHALDWRDEVFPMTMRLAEDVLEYTAEAEFSYPQVQQLTARIIADPCDEEALAALQEEIAYLSDLAWMYLVRAEESEILLTDFAVAMAQDDGRLELLLEEYEGSQLASAEHYAELQGRIADEESVLPGLEKDYQHYLTVASTSVTYVWIWPFGTIAASSTASVYGKKAADTKRTIDQTKARIRDLKHEATKVERLSELLAEAALAVASTEDQVSSALPTVERVRGHWDSLSGDLDALAEILRESPQTAIPYLKYLQLELALSEWREVARLAQGFVENATL